MRQVTIENISFFFVLFFLHIVVEMEIGDIYILLFFPIVDICFSSSFYFIFCEPIFRSIFFSLFLSYVMVREIKIEKVWKIPK